MSKTASSIVVVYTLCAALSTVINISSQMASVSLYTGSFSTEISILVGTAVGLPLRYILEKRFVFSFKSQNISHDGMLFMFYSFLGVFTTSIFWIVEYSFHIMFSTDAMRYLGGVLGLTIGFYVKYKLDKKYVFTNANKQVVI